MPYQLSLCSGLKEDFSQAHSALLGTWQAINESEFPQLCPTLCDPMDYTSPWNSLRQNTGVGSLFLLQAPGLPHCRRILYQLSHKGNP